MVQKNFFPYGRQDIDEEDIAAVTRILRSDIITRGPVVEKFEQNVAHFCGANFAVAVNSGSSALAACYHVLDLNEHDRVLLPPNTFIADIASVMQRKATPIFVDIDPSSGNICLESLEAALCKPQSRGKTIIVPVHFAGIAVDMQKLERLLRSSSTVVIEDAAHALGSHYPCNAKVGNCHYSSLSILSFHPLKNITTGEGGMILTNDEELYRRLKLFRDNGIERDPENFIGAERGPWCYEVQDVSNNYHLTAFQAALGISQLQRLPHFIEKRNSLINCYKKTLGSHPHIKLIVPQDKKVPTAFHLAAFQIDFNAFKTTREKVMVELKNKGIGSQVHYIPLYRHPYFVERFGDLSPYFPGMEKYYQQALTLPLYYKLKPENINYIVESLLNILKSS